MVLGRVQSNCGWGCNLKSWLGLEGSHFTFLAADFLKNEWLNREGERERDRQGGRGGEKCTKGGSHRTLIILEMTSHPFFHILLVTNTNSGTMWEVTTQGCEYQQAGISVGYFGGWLASYFTKRERKNNFIFRGS